MWVFTAGHAVDDLYQGAVPALLPFFVAARHWDYAAASGITVAATVLSSVIQPVFGFLGDRRHMPWLVAVGMALAGTGVGLSGLGRSYLSTWGAVALSGVGVAIYHPEAARLARVASRGSHVAMSWFSTGGSVGFTLGPVLVGAVLGVLGAGGTLPLAAPALACAAFTLVMLRQDPAAWRRSQPRVSRQEARAGDDWVGFSKLVVAVVARSVVTFGLGTFLALFVEARLHVGAGIGEAALVCFYGIGAAGTVSGGWLAERWGRVRALRASYLAAIPALAALLLVPGPAVFTAIAACAVVFHVPFSFDVTLGQDYLPTRAGTASGITLGLAVGIGGLATVLLGLLADHTDLRSALAVLTLFPAVSAVAGLAMHEPGRR